MIYAKYNIKHYIFISIWYTIGIWYTSLLTFESGSVLKASCYWLLTWILISVRSACFLFKCCITGAHGLDTISWQILHFIESLFFIVVKYIKKFWLFVAIFFIYYIFINLYFYNITERMLKQIDSDKIIGTIWGR